MTTITSSVSTTLPADINDLTLTGMADINGTGNSLNNVITGNAGANTLNGMAGADTLIGGAGNDTYVVDNPGDVVIENPGEGTDTVLSSISHTLAANVENLTLTGSASINGTGNELDNVITGNAGNNVLSGMGGNDTLLGGAGNDTLDGGTGADNMQGGTGDDIYVVDNAGDVVSEAANAGEDTIRSAISFTLGANFENLALTGTANLDGAGNELDNTITGNAGSNHLSGNAGNDTLDGGTGADQMDGGVGDDIYVVDDAGDLVIEAAGAGADLVKSSISYTLVENVENLTLTGTAAIDGTGNALDNVITGNSGANVLSGGAGDDTLDGGAGADRLLGGTGDDTYVVDNTGDVVIENAGEGTDTVRASVSYSLADNVENLVLTGSANISGTGNGLDNVITGNGGSNALYGQDGNDTLIGNAGNDVLDGGTGADDMQGGAGNDTYVVDDAGDVVTEAAGAGVDTVQSSIDYTLTANVENLTLLGGADLIATGNAADNVITGNSGNNTVYAAGGNDTVDAGAGDDVVYGGDGNDMLGGDAGADQLFGDAGNDTLDGGLGADRMEAGIGDDTYVVDDAGDRVIEAAGAGTDLVQSSITYTLTDNVENLTLTGTADINGTGNELDNVINGNGGANVLDGRAGNDTINGNAGNDTLIGGDGDDALNGGAGDDKLIGDAGNDTLNGGSGVDGMWGGTGDDTYVVDTAGDLVVENAGEGNDTVQASVTYTLTDNVENLTLTGSGTINGTGNALDNVITGNGGSNVLSGLEGNDTLIGAAGNDTLDGGTGADNMQGGTGNDTYVVDNTGDLVIEALGAGTDTVQSSIDYTLTANVENLTLLGAANLVGTGNALANVITGNSGSNVESGGDGNDTLYGNGGNDVLYGDAGNDLLDGGTGADRMEGGIGNDTYVVDDNGDLVVEAAAAGTDQVQSSITYTLTANVENLALTGTADINGTGNGLDNIIDGNTGANVLNGGAGNDTISADAGNDIVFGGDGDDTLNGEAGDDQLNGDAGNDVLNGGVGVDVMRGGVGDDTYIVDNALDAVIENAGEGVDTVQASIAYTLAANVENLTLTGTANINGAGNALDNVITGNGGNNILSGLDGNDTLVGNAGNDTLDGGTGADNMQGGAGNDTYVVDNAGDVVTEASGAGTDTVQASVDYTLGANLENLTLLGAADLNGTGNAAANTLIGNSGNNVLAGGAGNDTLAGGAGNDQLDGGTGADSMQGGTGDDTYIVDNTLDVVLENAGEGVDSVQSSISYKLTANVENLSLAGSANIDGTGNALANVITGGSGNNVLDGQDGNDTLVGGAGNDTLIGGTGADSLQGGLGDDTYQIRVGDGADRLIDSQGSDTLSFGPGLVRANMVAQRSGNDLVLSFTGTSDGVTLVNWGAQAEGVGRIVFSDGTSLDRAAINALLDGAPPAGRAPTAADDALSVGEDVGAVQVSVSQLLANDTDPDAGAVLSVVSVGQSALGATVVLDGDTVQYQFGDAFQSLGQGQVLHDTFTYTITDETGKTSTAVVHMDIVGANDAPSAADDSAAVNVGVSATASGNVLDNDRDVDAGTELQVAAPGTYTGLYGKLVLAQDGTYTYTLNDPAAAKAALAQGQPLVDSFSYLATDGIASSAAQLNVTITGAVNHAPVASEDAAQMAEDGPVQASGNVLANDSDLDAGTVLKVAAPGTYKGAYGTLTLAADGSYTYTLDGDSAAVQSLAQGQSVIDSFSYEATDGEAGVASTLNITIAGTNDAPVVGADAAQVAEDGAAHASGNVLANDSDLDAGTLLQVAAPGTYTGTYGTLVLAADGSYTYTLNNTASTVQALAQGQSVVDSFTYAATDGAASVASKLDITVTGANDAPVLKADTAVLADLAGSVSGNVLANDTDVDAGAVLKAVAGSFDGKYGKLVLLEDGSYTYKLDAPGTAGQYLGRDANVVEHFTYTATDGIASGSATLDISVSGINHAPVLVKPLADQYVNFNKSFSFKLPAGSFVDPDLGDVLTYTATLADGSALPSWLKFDAATGTFSGTAPKDLLKIDVRVTATDKVALTGSTAGSMSASDVFKLAVTHGNAGLGNGSDDAPPPGQDTDHNDGPGTGPGNPGAPSGSNAPATALDIGIWAAWNDMTFSGASAGGQLASATELAVPGDGSESLVQLVGLTHHGLAHLLLA
jgi:trimeric autotransporter adhesin